MHSIKMTMVLVTSGLVLSACSVNPYEVAPRSSAAEGAIASCKVKSADEAGLAMFLLPNVRAQLYGLRSEQLAPAVVADTLATIGRRTHRFDEAVGTLPAKLQNDPVMRNVMRVMITRKLDAFQSAVRRAPNGAVADMFGGAMARALDEAKVTDADLRLRVEASIVDEKERNRPQRLTADDFKAFHKAMLSPKGDLVDRTVNYEMFYFTDRFVDRFGSKLAKPTLSLNITNEDINGTLTALLESVADELFPHTPVWTDAKPKTQGRARLALAPLAADPKYFPGGTTKLPSVLVVNQMFSTGSTKPDEAAAAGLAVPLADDKAGCGMTELKAEALMYVSGKSATWAAGQSGFVMGLLGGTNLGFPIALAKFSIGDNQTLQTVVQTILAFAARRGTYEAAWPLLYNIDQNKYPTLAALLKALVLDADD